MPDDDVQFRSPTTGKVQAVPQEHWNEALKLGYMPTTHKVMYSPKGERGMVPNEELRDYVKRGYQTTPLTKFEQEHAPGYKSPGDIEFAKTIGLKPTDIKGVMEAAALGVGGGGIAKAIAKHGIKAAIGPLLKGIAGTTAGAATGHYLGRMVGLPEEGAAIGGLAGGLMGGFSGEKVPTPEPEPFPPEATTTGRPSMTSPTGQTILRPRPVPPPPPAAPGAFPGASTSGPPSMTSASGQTQLRPRIAPPTKPLLPDPFGGMTSSGRPSMTSPAGPTQLAPEPAAAARTNGSATPTPVEQAVARSKGGKTSILSRGSTLYKLGEEPDPSNPVHVKVINDLQTRSGTELRAMAKNGDRFAAFVLRNMPRPQ